MWNHPSFLVTVFQFFLLLFFLMLLELTVACLLLVYEGQVSSPPPTLSLCTANSVLFKCHLTLQIANLLKADLTKGLEEAKGKHGNSTNIMSEWDFVQEKVRLLERADVLTSTSMFS